MRCALCNHKHNFGRINNYVGLFEQTASASAILDSSDSNHRYRHHFFKGKADDQMG